MHQRLNKGSTSTLVALFCVVCLVGTSCARSIIQTSKPKVLQGVGGTSLANFSSPRGFYKVPSHLRAGLPGQLIRLQIVSDSSDETTLRVMYHSRDGSGHDRAVTGLITYPNSRAPRGGWPVVAWDHGTSGMSQSCAPSRAGGAVPSFGVDGVSVATDYLGLGPDGEIHPYLNRQTEAQATIDIVRAARNIPDAHASSKWVVVGDSQGGHASLSTGEIAPHYAPELQLVGTVAVAPGSQLSQVFPGDNPILNDVVTVMALYGAQVTDPKINPSDFLTPDATGVATVIKTSCVTQIADFLLKVYSKDGGKIFKIDPIDTARGRAWLLANEVGLVKTKSPILVIGGNQDAIVVPARIHSLMSQLCSIGDRAFLDQIVDGNHGNEIVLGATEITSWLKGRLSGAPAPSSCSSKPTNTSQAPT